MPSTQTTFDAIVVGSGACGALVAKELAENGFSVAVLEAGQRFTPRTDFANAESNGAKIHWTEPRVHVGQGFAPPLNGRGVGGTTLTWTAVMPRFYPEDFQTYSREGVGADWPIGYQDLVPYYAKVERELGVAGDCGPSFPEPYALPMPSHRMNWHAQVLSRGARKLGAQPFAAPVAINSVEHNGRPACCYCGWCFSGCPTGAKATSVQTHLDHAERLGARTFSGAFVRQVLYDPRRARVTGVSYLDSEQREHQLAARIVVLAAHAVETPRLLFLSAGTSFPEGLANSSGLVGRGLMSHPTWQVFGFFDEPINAYKGMQMGHVMIQDDYRANSRRGYARGYVLLSFMVTPLLYSFLLGDSYGAEFKQLLHGYSHAAAWWAHAEGLPSDENAVSLDPHVRDSRGLPVARMTYEWLENDLRLVAAARDRAGEMLDASGARRIHPGANFAAHTMGTCRMGLDPRASVVNPYCQTHDIRNLFICDTSVFVTGAGVNPTLTAMAIASRSAEYIVASGRRGDL